LTRQPEALKIKWGARKGQEWGDQEVLSEAKMKVQHGKTRGSKIHGVKRGYEQRAGKTEIGKQKSKRLSHEGGVGTDKKKSLKHTKQGGVEKEVESSLQFQAPVGRWIVTLYLKKGQNAKGRDLIHWGKKKKKNTCG